jgi:phosphoglycolate phosphatase
VSKALIRAGLPDTEVNHHRFRDAYLPLLAEEIQHPGTGHKGLMPGARELLEALHDYEHLHLALLTGNYREAAAIKLQHFELWDFFEWGAFSDDHADRNQLVPVAKSRAETYDIPVAAIERVIVIGDTPHDVECARVAGATCIAVATGGYTVEQLREAGADQVLPDLADTERVLQLLI